MEAEISAPPTPDEDLQAAVDAVARCGTKTGAALALPLNLSTLSHRLREAARRGIFSIIEPPKPALTLKGQSVLYDPDGNERARWDKTKLEGRAVEDTVQLPDPKKITKVSTLYDQAGKVTQQWIAEKPEEAAREELWRVFAEQIAIEIPRADPIPMPMGASNKDLLAVYPIGDHHHGMLAWGLETGGANYDMKISEQRLRESSLRLIDTCPPCDQALVAFLGDFFHYDSYSSVTPQSKNLLDPDGRFPKMIDIGVRMIRNVIDAALERHQKVRVIFERGNHDTSTAAAVTVFLAHLYEKEPRVSVDTSPMNCHYYEFGKVLLGVTHGDKMKADKLPGIMAHDQSEAWGRTLFRIWMTGHFHTQSLKEYPGCSVEGFAVLAEQDAWSSGEGYRSACQMKAIVFHREHGEVERHTVNPGMFKVAA